MAKFRKEAPDWWEESKNNLRQSRKNIEIREFSVAAFLAHQSAEKSLKAAYIVKKKRLPPLGPRPSKALPSPQLPRYDG